MNLWSQHLNQLLQIIKRRHNLYGPERYSFIIWWVFVIDVHAVLTGGGDGVYAESLLKSDLLPETIRPLQRPGTAGSISPRPIENESAPSVLEFHRKIYVQAASLGLLARDLREEVVQHRNHVLTPREIRSRQQRVVRARDLLEQTWNADAFVFQALGYANENVAVKDRGIFEHVSRTLASFETLTMGMARERSYSMSLHLVSSDRSLFLPFLHHLTLLEILTQAIDVRPIPCMHHLLAHHHVADPAPRIRASHPP